MERKLTYNELRQERDQLKSELEKALSTIKHLVEQRESMISKYSNLT